MQVSANLIAQPTTQIDGGYSMGVGVFMTRPLEVITWFRTQISVARALLCASTLNMTYDSIVIFYIQKTLMI